MVISHARSTTTRSFSRSLAIMASSSAEKSTLTITPAFVFLKIIPVVFSSCLMLTRVGFLQVCCCKQVALGPYGETLIGPAAIHDVGGALPIFGMGTTSDTRGLLIGKSMKAWPGC